MCRSSSSSSLSAARFPWRAFQVVKNRVEPLEAGLPILAIALEPFGGLGHWPGLEPARPPLRVLAGRDEPGPLQHLEVLRDRRLAHVERLGQLRDRGLAPG